MSTLTLGIGTGRCGTHSLAALLDSQSRSSVTHERFKAQVPWTVEGYEWMKHLIDQRPTDAAFYGDVSFYWLPQIERLLLDSETPTVSDTLRVVALRRDREATVESYMRKTEGPHGRNHWMVHDGTSYPPCTLGWDDCYPKFHASTKREAISMYWSYYYGEVDRLSTLYPERVRCFDLDALNSQEGQRSILQFVGIPSSRQVFQVGVQINPSAPVRERKTSTRFRTRLSALYRRIVSQ